MSNTVTEAFIQQFNRNVYVLSQQEGSKLRGKLRSETVSAKKAFFDRIAPSQRPQKKISRHQDTPLTEQVHSRRAVDLTDYVLADMVDREDQIRMLIEPQSLYARNFAMSFGREQDIAMITAFTAAADTGQFGGTSVNFPAGNTIDLNGPLTVATVRQLKLIFDQANVRDDGRIMICSAQALDDLLNLTEVTNSDYNTVKALVSGSVEGNRWMGFEWVRLADEILPLNRRGTDEVTDRSCYMVQRDGVAFAIGQELRTEMDRRPDKMNNLQVMCTASFNAVRVDDDTVVEFLVRET